MSFLQFSDRTYLFLKWFVSIVMPATATMYFTVAKLWGYDTHIEQVMGTMVAINTFLGVVLGISNYNYNKDDGKYDGTMIVNKSEDGQVYKLDLKDDPIRLGTKNEVIFKVDPNASN